jgi:hypothetical protein
MGNIVFTVALDATQLDWRLGLFELGIGRDEIIPLVQTTSCSHLLEFEACWNAQT